MLLLTQLGLIDLGSVRENGEHRSIFASREPVEKHLFLVLVTIGSAGLEFLVLMRIILPMIPVE